MIALLISIYVPVLALIWTFTYLALRWLRTGRPFPRWAWRRARRRGDAYGIAANGGLLTGMFVILPGSPWLHRLQATSLDRSPVLYFGPLVLFPVLFLTAAALCERAGRRRTGVASNGPTTPTPPQPEP